MSEYEVRPIEERDYNSIMEIENLCFVSPWTLDQLIGEIKENMFSNIFVLEESVNGINKVVGYYDYWITFDSATIAQIAVHPTYQSKHLGSLMLKEIIDDCYAKKVSNITLEVRENNVKAQNLYKKYGFQVVTVKPHYYDNGDNALYMVKKVNLNG